MSHNHQLTRKFNNDQIDFFKNHGSKLNIDIKFKEKKIIILIKIYFLKYYVIFNFIF